MFLKSLEIQGFKSFAEKTEFDFQKGITGIVGPNGSGKSNVSDAVKWVLGEQSAKQLRGGKMEDVIFAGTETRKPVGFASVAITFDNADRKLDIDYDEVTVSRKVFRSGESEYKINNNVCRLRDIEELFYDTGIGKEGYSLIGQGRIDKILSGRADERRELFDEAAGIVKYKRRKERAIKQLAIESDNLNRVNDILQELETRVGPLKNQAEKAKKYLELKEELKRFDCTSFILQSDMSGEELKGLEENIGIVTGDYDKARTDYDGMRQQYAEAEERLESLSNQEEQIKERTAELNEAIREKSAGVSVLEEQIRSLGESIEEAKGGADKFSGRIPEKDEQIKELKDKKAELAVSVDEFNTKQQALEEERQNAKAESERLEKEGHEGSENILEAVRKQSEKSALIDKLKFQIQNLTAAIAAQEEQEDALGRLREERAELARKAQEEFDKATRAVDESLENKEKIKEEIRINAEEEAKDSGKLHDLKNTRVKEVSDLEALKGVTERYEGYSESIRKVMEVSKDEKGVDGVVADIFKTEPKYETAIETALGASLQHIVTETEKQAKELVEYLKVKKAGRATFLPLDAIKAKNPIDENDFKGEPGVVGRATQLVSNDDKYSELAMYLLGRILVVDNMDNALKLARKKSYSVKMVTLEGEMLNPGGSITGGAYKHAGNLLSRRRKITEAEKKIKALDADIGKLEKTVDEHLKLKEALREKFEKADEEAVKAGIDRNTAGINLKNAKDQEQEALNTKAAEDDKLKNLGDELKNINADLESETKALEEIKAHEETLRVQLQERRDAGAESLKAFDEAGAKLEELRLSFSTTLQQDKYIDEQISRIEEEKLELQREIEQLGTKCTDLETALDEKKKEISDLEEEVEKAKTEIEDCEKKDAALKEERRELNEKNKTFFAKREKLAETLNELDKELFRLNAKKEKLENTLESLTEYMWQEYELTYSYAVEFKDDTLTDLAQIKRHCQELKDDIRALGDVNVNAIEEFKETNGRYEFLSTQHDDLIKATASLKGVISDLDKGMREQFVEKFKDINKEFSKVFKELFGGGKGAVELQEGEDILDADVAIIAQPPGKKLQNMLQLSGGERALTAIALLFAIQNLKPSPFCLLDEIEAALDDANIGRFASFLGRLADKTQYIVITHRRGTMAVADRLYGITMQEKGVSALVSVELKK